MSRLIVILIGGRRRRRSRSRTCKVYTGPIAVHKVRIGSNSVVIVELWVVRRSATIQWVMVIVTGESSRTNNGTDLDARHWDRLHRPGTYGRWNGHGTVIIGIVL